MVHSSLIFTLRVSFALFCFAFLGKMHCLQTFRTTVMMFTIATAAVAAVTTAAQQEQQHAFTPPAPLSSAVDLHGKFLHITDIHLDPIYKPGGTIASGCHTIPKKHRKKKLRKGKLGDYWGTPTSGCDAPAQWVDRALSLIGEAWSHDIDFIVWTGDNARHGLDEKHPRTSEEIVEINRKVTDMIKKHFWNDGPSGRFLPIVPCIGNNDIHPHNKIGPKSPYFEIYGDLWKEFIPADQMDVFLSGGYFAVNVAPHIRVLSLNTLFFFNSNSWVNGCADPTSAGSEHLDWMRGELARARTDGARVYIIGHVPPSERTFYDDCLGPYRALSLEYQDVIMAQLYGHVNYDHFIVLEEPGGPKALKSPEKYLDELRETYKRVDKEEHAYVVVHVAPPILPVFYPSYRINEFEKDRRDMYGRWTRYTQYYANLTHYNWDEHGRKRKPAFQFEYATDTTYGLMDLSTASWLDLAQRMTEKKSKKAKSLWDTYVRNTLVQTELDS
ncbi:Metallo-dependent phosphatase-like protein [Dichotomocladium elegans]|nr:Metallo-dependent phosphatase-like protein [Dichotomocladium elegans]